MKIAIRKTRQTIVIATAATLVTSDQRAMSVAASLAVAREITIATAQRRTISSQTEIGRRTDSFGTGSSVLACGGE